MIYNQIQLESMSHNLFPDSESSEQSAREQHIDRKYTYKDKLKLKNKTDRGDCLLFDPVDFDDNNFMKFKKRVSKDNIMQKMKRMITEKI